MKKRIYLLFLTGIFILSIGIALFIFIETKDLEKDSNSKRIIEEENDMVTIFEWYQYIDSGGNLTYLPENTHLIIETTLALYYVRADDETELWKYTIATKTNSQVDVDPDNDSGDVKSRIRKIQTAWNDVANTTIWFADCDNDGVDDDFDVWKIDYSTDTVTDIGQATPTGNEILVIDIFIEGVDVFVNLQDGITLRSYIYEVDTAPFTLEDDLVVGLLSMFGVVIGTKYYWAIDAGGVGVVWIKQYDDATQTITLKDSITGYSVPASKDQYGLSYDGNNLIYFVLIKDADGKNYLMSYSITGDVITDTGLEYNIALMMDRNTIGTAGSPWEYEKAFHLTFSNIYQIHSDYKYLTKIQDLGLTGGATIKAITDKYLIDSNKNVYEYTESIISFPKARCTYGIYTPPKGEFSYQTSLSTDQLIEIYENAAGTYTKAFSGRAGAPQYNNTIAMYEFKCINFGADDLNRPVSKTVAAAGIDETVIALINDNSTFLYADATSVPNIATNITYTWEDQRLKDVLYTIAILANGYWWFEPSGYFYFRAYSAAPNAEDGYYPGEPDNFNDETVGAITSAGDMDFIDTLTLPNACTCELLEEFDEHKNILALHHDAGAGDPEIGHDFPNGAEVSGTREWYISISDVTKALWFYFKYAAATKVLFLINGSKIYHYPDGVSTDTGVVPVNSILNHIKITFDCSAGVKGEYQLYIDEDQIGATHEMFAATTHLDEFGINPTINAVHSSYLGAWGDPADDNYAVGDNLVEFSLFTQATGDIGPPRMRKLMQQYNTWIIEGGINTATNKPFTKTETDDDAILQYGELNWKGRDSFPEARTQAALDAIVTALKAWQGMQDNPDDAVSLVSGKYYYPVGYKVSYQYTFLTEFATAQDMLIGGVRINYKDPGLVQVLFTTNIMRGR